jgi:hypothetical protein
MKRTSFAFGLTLLCLVLAPAAASAAPGSGKGPKQDLVAGTGRTDSYAVHVNAQSGPNGEDPRGKVRFEVTSDPTGFFNVNADVTCMDVQGHDSVVAGIRDDGLVFYIWISDNGQGNGTPDAFQPFFFFGGSAPPPGTCFATPGAIPADRGNFTVHDSTP